MGRSIEEIQADIARVKAEMALRNKYEQGFNQPQTKTGWSSYIVNGDRGLLDAYQNRENQWKNQMQQQGYQAAQNALNRKFQEEQGAENRNLQLEIAKMNKSNADADAAIVKAREAKKTQLEADMAQADYDDAISKVDLDKPETILAAKKAALKLNYANSNLPYFDKEVHTVSTEFKEDSPGVAKTKRVNNAVKYLDTITGVPADRWSDDEVSNYEEQIEILRNDAPELVKKYEVEMSKKGPSVEQRKKAKAQRKKAFEAYGPKYKKPDGTIRPGSLQQLIDTDPIFKKLYNEFGGGK